MERDEVSNNRDSKKNMLFALNAPRVMLETISGRTALVILNYFIHSNIHNF